MKRKCDPQTENGPSQKRLPDKSEQLEYECIAKQKTKLEEVQQKLYQDQKEMVEKKEGEIVSLQGKMEMQIELMEEKERKLTEMESEVENMQTQITEKDEALKEQSNALKRESRKLSKKRKALKEQQHENEVLEQEKTKLEEELLCKAKMLGEEERRHQEQKEMVKKKEGVIVSLQGKMKEKIKLVEKKQKELNEMEKEREEMKTQVMEKDKKIMTLQQNQHNVDILVEHAEGFLRKVHHITAGGEGVQEINKPSNAEEDILMPKTSCLELKNEVTMKQAALDGIKTVMEKDGECSICKELIIKATTLNCSHSFCDFCIQKWLKLKKDDRCPHCRKEVKQRAPCIALDNLIEGIVDKLGDQTKQRREKAVKEREQQMQEEEKLHSDYEYNSQSDDYASGVASAYSANSPASPWYQLSVDEPLQLREYRPSRPDIF